VQSVFPLHCVYIAAFTFHEISYYRKTTFSCFKADASLIGAISGLEVTCCDVYASACGIHIKFALYNTSAVEAVRGERVGDYSGWAT
jgi:hypothetical protein